MKFLTTFLALFFAIGLSAQVNFENISLSEAISKSAASGKIVFAHFVSSDCDRRNEDADKAFAIRTLGDIVDKKCVAIKVELNSSDRHQFIKSYNFDELPGTFFIAGDGHLIHKYAVATTKPSEYVTQIDKAYRKITERKARLQQLDDEWSKSSVDMLGMEANIQKRSALSLPTDSLLEVYVNSLPTDSLVSVRVLQFIALQAPSLFSNANSRLRMHLDLFLAIWYNWPKELRKQLNNAIIQKSIRQAIKERDVIKAKDVAAYSLGTYPETVGVHTKQKAYDRQMLDFYVGINDSKEYVSKALAYYDKYYSTLPIFEFEEEESAIVNVNRNAAKEDTIWDNPGKFKIRKKAPNSARSPFYSSEVRRLATLIYTSTNDQYYLKRAVEMAAKANELYETSSTMDTYARIMYKLGNKEEAIAWEEKAINFNKAKKLSIAGNLRVLASMKNGTFQ